MPSNQSLYAYEDEPFWSMCLREYVIPSAVFILLAYYLLFRVLLPMRRINRPTRQTEEEVAATDAAAVAAKITARDASAEAAPTTEGKKEA